MEFTTKIYFKRFFLSVSVRSRWDVKDFEMTEVPSSIEFIGYRIPQHKQNNYIVLFTRHQSTKLCREILVFKIFFLWRPFTQHISLIFSYSNFRCGYLMTTNQNIQKARHTFVYWYFVNDCVHSFCSCCGIQYPINSLERTSVVSTLTASSHLLKRKFA